MCSRAQNTGITGVSALILPCVSFLACGIRVLFNLWATKFIFVNRSHTNGSRWLQKIITITAMIMTTALQSISADTVHSVTHRAVAWSLAASHNGAVPTTSGTHRWVSAHQNLDNWTNTDTTQGRVGPDMDLEGGCMSSIARLASGHLAPPT